ncbi:peptide/nickel transport system substrate-binding protein [Cryobacterium psychrotolerans]|uniref:Peptide/nickel transport system substrate-binding protein n=1 Tax=Cryobacterium psychrotolerans TaxID=386301 RepID=A0A1G8YJP6_9MICO|nr:MULTISPECIES: ABC transporter substrate-binding protein [Cryobacterium]TFD40907.1 ABC transporter substrate-binding protein [Cryobacterium sp. TMT1-2-1]TFD85326.1 ABC transporter substrate-binding protein [Cryobacterium psychrotolerans]SDK02981.1 peptide/nickel transport system substrate-binding protein [Cryobacterium psychrotolerans]
MKHLRGRITRTALAVIGVTAVLATSACSIDVKNKANNDAPASDGSLLVAADNGSPTFEKNFNPFSPSKRVATTYMYEPLQVINTLDGKATPFLATGNTLPDAQTVVYDIRTGVKWSDGTAFTAADVAFTFNLIKATPALDVQGAWQHIKSLEVKDDTVVFHLKAEDVPAVAIINQQLIVPEHIWKDVKDPLTFTNEEPVASGPYVLDKFSPNEYTLKKNKDYWQADKVAVDKLVLPAANSQLDVVNNGYDWAYAFMTDVEGTWVNADKQHNSYWFPPGGTIALLPNLTKAPFNDLDFREGLSFALDRDKIAVDAEQGYVEAAGQSGLLLPNQEEWLSEDLPNSGAIGQDTEKALAAFEKAGYTKKGDKLVDKAGKQLKITITTANGYTDWLQGLQTVQAQLGKLGIDVKLSQPQPAAYYKALNNGDFDIAITGFGGTGSVFEDFNRLLNSEFATPVGTSTTANFQRFTDPKVDALLADLKAATGEEEQKQIAAELQGVVYEQLPVISMFYGGLWGLYSDKNFTGWPTEDNAYAPPNTWNSTPLLILTNLKKAS